MAIRKRRMDRDARFAEQAAHAIGLIAPPPPAAGDRPPVLIVSTPAPVRPRVAVAGPVAPLEGAGLAGHTVGRPGIAGEGEPGGVPVLAAPRLVLVIAAHPGAGASVVACAIAEAAAAAGRVTRLVDLAPATRSGLITAADAELGVSGDGLWQVGRRGTGRLLVERARGGTTFREPEPADQLLVVDGAQPTDARWASAGLVLVARATVPGGRRVGALLEEFGDRVAAVAMPGPARWPGAVAAAAGAAARSARDADRCVPVPIDKQLEIEGISSAPLPGRVLVAGARLLELIQRTPATPISATDNPRCEGET